MTTVGGKSYFLRLDDVRSIERAVGTGERRNRSVSPLHMSSPNPNQK